MASQSAPEAGSPPSAQVVGNAFVQQYYHILHHSPQLVFRFYQEGSKLGRPEPYGALSSSTTLEAINEKILSMDYGEYTAEIKTVDAQESLHGGVIVLVTGYLTGKDNVKKDFTQSFFLATQDKGYFVLNDIFRFVDKGDQPEVRPTLLNDASTPHSEDEESVVPQERVVNVDTVMPPGEDEGVNEEEVYNPSDNEEGSVVEEEPPVEEVINEVPDSSQLVAADLSSVTIKAEAPKKSYASIVKVPASLSASSAPKPAPPSVEKQPAAAPAPTPAPEIPTASSNTAESSSTQEAEADGHSIYIKSLPLTATSAQLEEQFKKFGPIKPNGIQVRSHKQQGFCFGFVEFEVASAVQRAIEASPIMIGGRHAYVEEKRPTGSRVGSRGRFAPTRGGGFRGDGMRGRGGYSSGRGYGRVDFTNRPEYGGRGGGGRGGSSGRGGELGYQRVDHTGTTGGGRGSGSGSLSSPRSDTPRVPASA